jgi:hypothetical protein
VNATCCEWDVDPAGLPGSSDGYIDLLLQVPPAWPVDLEKRIKEICETRVRYGYRRIHVVLRREDWMINIKRTRRLYVGLACNCGPKHPSGVSRAAGRPGARP